MDGQDNLKKGRIGRIGPNKVTKTVKDNVLAVFNRLGGTAGMAIWAKEHQTEFYQIYAKLLPRELKASVDVRHKAPSEMTLQELDERIARLTVREEAQASSSAEPSGIH